VLIVFAIILLVVAGLYLALRGGGQDAAPDDQYVDFRCQACGESFRLSYREFEERYDRTRRFELAEDGRTLLFECPKCGEMKGERVLPGRSSAGRPE
jgi:predicted RNA-binding Zn-ribbon protein involved in translation (DUF1610 family)